MSKENRSFVQPIVGSQFVDGLVTEDSQTYHPQIGRGMANHFPMAVLALAGLGGNDKQVFKYASMAGRRSKLPSQSSDTDINLDNWVAHLGDREYLLDFNRFFVETLQEKGKEETLKTVLPVLFSGTPKGLFHPVIRLSFAISHDVEQEIADALSYWAIRYEPLYEGIRQEDQTEFLGEILDEENVSQKWTLEEIHDDLRSRYSGAFFGRASINICLNMCEDEDFRKEALQGLVLNDDNALDQMRKMTELAARLYGFKPALTTLHGTTGAQAVLDCVKFVENKVLPVKWYWIWLSALFVEKGSPELIEYDEDDDLTWDDLSATACKSTETHVIKLAYTLKLLDAERHAPVFKAVCEQMLERGSPW